MSVEKDVLRRKVLQYRRSMPLPEKAASDAAITARVLQSGVYQTAQTVFCYVSLPQEIDTRAILSDAWVRGKRVAVPRCRTGGEMDFYVVHTFDDLSTGMRGISEPNDDCALCLPQETDLCIVPCLAADVRGYRLGYGGGYYDRWLSAFPIRTLGLCYAACVMRALPTEPFDVPIQTLICEKEV